MLRVYVRILCKSVCIRVFVCVCVCVFNRMCMASVMQKCVKCEKKTDTKRYR